MVKRVCLLFCNLNYAMPFFLSLPLKHLKFLNFLSFSFSFFFKKINLTWQYMWHLVVINVNI